MQSHHYIASVASWMLASLLFITSAASGEAAPTAVVIGDGAPLSAFQEYAEAHNPGLAAMSEKAEAARAIIPWERSLPDPVLGYTIEDMRPTGGSFKHNANVSQMFPWFGKRGLMGDRAGVMAEMSVSMERTERLSLRTMVAEAFTGHVYLLRSAEVSAEGLSLLAAVERAVRARYTVGRESQSSLLKVQIESAKREEELAAARDLIAPSAAKLNTLLGNPPDAPLPRPGPIPEETIAFSESELLAMIEEHNPGLETARLETRRTELTLELAGRERKPDFMLGLGIGNGSGSSMKSGLNVMGMVSLNLPVRGARYRALEGQAAAAERSAMKGRENLSRTLASELKSALFMYRDAVRRIGLYRDSLLPKSHQAFEVALRTFESGNGSFLDIMDSFETTLDLELALEQSLADGAVAVAKICELTGNDRLDVKKP